jgi:hypothetical protein
MFYDYVDFINSRKRSEISHFKIYKYSYRSVIVRIYFQSLHNLILSLLKLNPEERPFIDEVKTKANAILAEVNNTVSC